MEENFKRKNKLNLPQYTELELARHFNELGEKNFCIEKGFYPLGSCTMKYNPRINEWAANLEGFLNIHPNQNDEDCQGALKLMFQLQEFLKIITGMDEITLQPCAGAHGELTGMMIVKKYFEDIENGKNGSGGENGAESIKNGSGKHRTKVIIPDSAHGTNPASAKMCGFEIVEVKSNNDGLVDIDSLKALIDEDVAAIMMTNPNTLGLFEENILEISEIMHKNGSLLYYDGANFNAIMGHTNPKLMGFDIVHLNLHKTFATPHGGGGPGSGPVGVTKELAKYLPIPKIEKRDDYYFRNSDYPSSIGKVSAFYGNFSVLVKAYTYILSMGKDLKKVSETAVLNANYLKEKLKNYYHIAFDKTCMHEFVINNEDKKQKGVSTLQIAKRLMDFDIHPPTIYFPLIVHEAMMIEPTETECKRVLDNFIDVMIKISEEIEKNPTDFENYPSKTPVKKVDETLAARQLDLRRQD